MSATAVLPPVEVICTRCQTRWQSRARRHVPVHCPRCKHLVRVKRPRDPDTGRTARTLDTPALVALGRAAPLPVRDWLADREVATGIGAHGCEITGVPRGPREPCPHRGGLHWGAGQHAQGDIQVCVLHYMTLASIADPPDCTAALLARCWTIRPHGAGLCEIVKPYPGAEPHRCPHPASIQVQAAGMLVMICGRCRDALSW